MSRVSTAVTLSFSAWGPVDTDGNNEGCDRPGNGPDRTRAVGQGSRVIPGPGCTPVGSRT
jgi:hypothetical protein